MLSSSPGGQSRRRGPWRKSTDATEPGGILACSLVGQRRGPAGGGSASQHLPATRRFRRHYCSYGLNDRYREALVAAGLVIGAADSGVGIEPRPPPTWRCSSPRWSSRQVCADLALIAAAHAARRDVTTI
jgi:hypothetical protein